jgi:hypothetical protein
MKTTSKELLESVSKHCYNQLTLYRFNTTTLQVSEKYREGRLTALEYLTELSYYYLQEEKSIEKQFKEQIMRQLTLYSCLDETEYKRGLYDALNEVLHL